MFYYSNESKAKVVHYCSLVLSIITLVLTSTNFVLIIIK